MLSRANLAIFITRLYPPVLPGFPVPTGTGFEPGFPGTPGHLRNTVLHVAAVHGHEEICKLIMENVDVNNCRNFDGDTPIDLARKSGQSSVIHLLQNSE